MIGAADASGGVADHGDPGDRGRRCRIGLAQVGGPDRAVRRARPRSSGIGPVRDRRLGGRCAVVGAALRGGEGVGAHIARGSAVEWPGGVADHGDPGGNVAGDDRTGADGDAVADV